MSKTEFLNDKEKFELELQKQKLILEDKELDLKDLDSARNREVELNKSEHSSYLAKNVTYILALGCVALTFILFYTILYIEIKQDSKDIIIYILGVLSAISTQIVSYYFGSSSGSERKTELMRFKNGL